MKKIVSVRRFFDVEDTLRCGQIFRFKPFSGGFLCFSKDKCCYAYSEGDKTTVEVEDGDEDYFADFFDLKTDYSSIVKAAKSFGIGILSRAAESGKGIRILGQDLNENLFSFIISQNNNIPRIKGCIEKLCSALGEEKSFCGEKYFSFPTAEKMAEKDEAFYKELGFGYRAEYVRRLAENITEGFSPEKLKSLTTEELRKSLLKIYGVGNKVADCVLLFGYGRRNAFPVDTWIQKVYEEDFGGELKDRKKIAAYFENLFGENSGVFQQYLFHYKRNLSGE